jgi:hypothetical protein
MTPLPKPLNDSGPFAKVINTIIRVIEERTLRSSDTVTVKHLQNCTTLHAEPPGQQQPPGEAGVHWEGEYDPMQSYTEQSLVVVRGGVSAGAYVANRDIPVGESPSYPDLGDGWVSLRSPEIIYWT